MKKKKRVKTIDIIIGLLVLAIIVIAVILIVNQNRVVFELKGDKVIKLNIGEEFNDPGFIIMRNGEDLSKVRNESYHAKFQVKPNESMFTDVSGQEK